MKFLKLGFLLGMVGVVVMTCGCRSTVTFAASTMIGVEINGVETGEQSAKVGYQRVEGVTMPLRFDEEAGSLDNSGEVMPDAYPVISAFKMKTGSLFSSSMGDMEIHQVFASGEAAADQKTVKLIRSRHEGR